MEEEGVFDPSLKKKKKKKKTPFDLDGVEAQDDETGGPGDDPEAKNASSGTKPDEPVEGMDIKAET